MNLYVINEVLCDYTPGMVVIAAESLDRCRAVFEQEFPSHWSLEEFDAAIAGNEYKVLKVQEQEEGVVSHVFGGG